MAAVPSYYLVILGAIAVCAILTIVRHIRVRYRRARRIERGQRNRARQFGWDMVFGRRPARLSDMRADRENPN